MRAVRGINPLVQLAEFARRFTFGSLAAIARNNITHGSPEHATCARKQYKRLWEHWISHFSSTECCAHRLHFVVLCG